MAKDAARTLNMVSTRLAAGEVLELVCTAFTPAPDDGDGYVISGALVPVLWAVNFLTWTHTTRKASQAAGVPLARRMMIAVTSQRLLIWKASRRWMLSELIGEIPRQQVSSVTTYGPAVAARGFVIHLSNGKSVTLQVSREAADHLTALLSG